MSATRKDALQAVRTLLDYIGEDVNREGLRDTPERVVSAWDDDFGLYYKTLPAKVEDVTTFNASADMDQMIFMGGIEVISHCEHHILPYFGTACFAYIPNDKIIGLSKIPRVIQHLASKLTVQENLTIEIAEFFTQTISANVAVMLNMTHSCMALRGIKSNARTTTTAIRGIFAVDASAHNEFLMQSRMYLNAK